MEPPPEDLEGFGRMVIYAVGKVESADLLAAPVDVERVQSA